MALSLSISKISKNWQLKCLKLLEVANELIHFIEQITWVYSVFSSTENLKLHGPKIWALMPNEMKQLESLGKFRNAIRQ